MAKRIVIDTKYTVWDRTTATVPDDIFDSVKAAILDGTYEFDLIADFDPNVESIDDTNEELPIIENSGNPTIELRDDDSDSVIADNSGTFSLDALIAQLYDTFGETAVAEALARR